MKSHIQKLLAVTILACSIVLSHAATDADNDLTQKLTKVLEARGKIHPGMTRAALTNDFTGYRIGRLDNSFQEQHQYSYLGCFLIKIDVVFVRSTSTEAQPTDVIAKISKPYLESNNP